jgi:hypothetical protein
MLSRLTGVMDGERPEIIRAFQDCVPEYSPNSPASESQSPVRLVA